jgi:hypothetical protein
LLTSFPVSLSLAVSQSFLEHGDPAEVVGRAGRLPMNGMCEIGKDSK